MFEKYGFTKLGLAGHPEGSPDISDADCALAIQQKNDYAKESAMSLYLATQFVFEAAPVLAWEKKIREQGNMLPVYVGITGIATINTLMPHVHHCGMGPSMRFLTRYPFVMIKLCLHNSVLCQCATAPQPHHQDIFIDLK